MVECEIDMIFSNVQCIVYVCGERCVFLFDGTLHLSF